MTFWPRDEAAHVQRAIRRSVAGTEARQSTQVTRVIQIIRFRSLRIRMQERVIVRHGQCDRHCSSFSPRRARKEQRGLPIPDELDSAEAASILCAVSILWFIMC